LPNGAIKIIMINGAIKIILANGAIKTILSNGMIKSIMPLGTISGSWFSCISCIALTLSLVSCLKTLGLVFVFIVYFE